MNKRRRKALEEVVIKIQEAVNELENLREEEEEYRDNFPDNLLSCEDMKLQKMHVTA